jgi:hypothetical protein
VNFLLEQLADPKLGVQATLTQSRGTMIETSQLLHKINDPQHGLPQVLINTSSTMNATQELINQLNDPRLGVSPTLHNANNLMIKVDGALDEVQQSNTYRWLVPKAAPKGAPALNAPAPSKD